MVLTISVLRVISCHGLVQKDCGSSFDPLSCKRCKFVSRVSHPKRFFLSSFSVKMATDTDIDAGSVSGIDIPVMLRGGCGVTVSDYEIPPSPLFPDFLGTHSSDRRMEKEKKLESFMSVRNFLFPWMHCGEIILLPLSPL